MNLPLNNKQRKLVEDNHNLIFSFLQSRGLSLDSNEDWYGVAAIGLCQAARSYDESIGTRFSTLAYKAMDNEVKRVFRAQSKEVVPAVSLDDFVSDDPALVVGNIIPDPHEELSSTNVTYAINKAVSKLNKHQREIVDLVLVHGLSQSDVARRLNLSYSRVNKICKNFECDVKSYCVD